MEHLLEHKDFVRRIARSLLFDENQVDDVVQQAWIAALRKGPSQPGALRSWLATVTRNLALNSRRGQGRRDNHERRVQPRELAPSAAEIAQREEMRRVVVEEVLRMPEPYRSTLVLRYLEELEPKEIARRTGDPASTVRVRLKRGLEQLRARLDARNGGDRRGWMLALVPFAATGAGVAAYAGQAGLSLGAKLSAAAVVVAAGTWWLLQGFGASHADEITPVVPQDREVVHDAAADRDAGAGEEVGDARTALVPEDDAGELPAAARAGFRGRLVDPAGEPVAHARLALLSGDVFRNFYARLTTSGSRGPNRVTDQSARSDEAGRFAFDGVWPRSFYVLAAGREDPREQRRILTTIPEPGQVVDLGDVVLSETVALEGRVVDADGHPVAGAWVWATAFPGLAVDVAKAQHLDPDGWLLQLLDDGRADPWSLELVPSATWDALPLPWTRTDGEGRYRLALLPDEDWAVVASAWPFEPWFRPRLKLKPGKPKELDIELGHGTTLQGHVVGDDGRPVPGAEVLVAPEPKLDRVPVAFAGRIVTTDAEGRFRRAGLPRSGGLIAAWRGGPAEPWQTRKLGSVHDEPELRLPARAGFELRVVGPGRRPAAAPELTLYPRDLGSEALLFGAVAPLDLDGHLRAGEQPGSFVLEGLARARYTLLVGDEGAVTQRVLVDLATAPVPPVEVRLEAATPLTVEVFAPDGRPVKGADVFSRRLDQPDWLKGSMQLFHQFSSDALPIHEGRTRGDGRLACTGLPAGKTWLTIRHPLYGQVERLCHLPSAVEVFRFEDPCTVEGRVLAEPAQLEAEPKMIHLWKVGGDDHEGMPAHPRLCKPDAEGRFRFTGVEPGQYILQVHPALDRCRTLEEVFDHFINLFWSNLATRRFELRPGEHKQQDLRWPGRDEDTEGTATVTCRVSIDGPADGKVVELRSWFSWMEKPKRQVVKGGAVSFAKLGAGTWALQVQDPTREGDAAVLYERRVELEDGEQEQVDVAIRMGVIEGYAYDPARRPLANTAIQLRAGTIEDEGGFWAEGPVRQVTTDAQGGFRAAELPRGAWQIVCDKPGLRGYVHVRLEGETLTGVELETGVGVLVAGTLREEAFKWNREESAGVGLTLRHKSGAFSCEATCGEDHRFRVEHVPPGEYQVQAWNERRVRNTSFKILEYCGQLVVPPTGLLDLQVKPYDPKAKD
ncbi:MAG: sigma-70 family RNA polymerase sigma factor [Planctomycetota bacterium]